jgi:hypothetical protein
VYALTTAKDGVVMLRFESAGAGQQVSEEVHQSSLTEQSFRQALSGARKQGNTYYRNLLQTEFRQVHLDRDAGKTVFVVDAEGFGLVPQSFGIKDAFLLGSSSIEGALSNLKQLRAPVKPDARITALFGLPHTEEEYIQVFGEPSGQSSFAPLDNWLPHWQEQRDLISLHKLNTLSPKDVNDKGAFLRELEDEDGVIMIVAHSDGAKIRLTDGRLLALSPEDIGNLKFRKKPFVFLRVCQGKDIGFADAFIRAGAVGVWTNRGPVTANIANKQADDFLQIIRSGKSVESAVQQIFQDDERARESTVLFSERTSPQFSGVN